VLARINCIEPKTYDKTRNYLDGSVTWLSPFLTHGIIDTIDIGKHVIANHTASASYRLLFELAWREYFHRTWQEQGDLIFGNLRSEQNGAKYDQLPSAFLNADTGIDVVDECIRALLSQGTLHNHARMWVAGISCNLAQTRWLQPARWLHYHLLDGDLASNTLSWQWVAGTFSHKQYVANQDNINKYSRRRQIGTWLDVPYEAFDNFPIPEVLRQRSEARFAIDVPGKTIEAVQGRVALRSIWDLNPLWQPKVDHQICFFDTDLLKQWPMSPKRWQFIQHWVDQCGASLVYGNLEELNKALAKASVQRHEYPACCEWPGNVIGREWLYSMPTCPIPSFSKFWKAVRGEVGL